MTKFILLALSLSFLACSVETATAEPSDDLESSLTPGVHNGYVFSACFAAGRMRLTTIDGWFYSPGPPVFAGYEGDVSIDGVPAGRVWLQTWTDGRVVSCGLANQRCVEIVQLGTAPCQ